MHHVRAVNKALTQLRSEFYHRSWEKKTNQSSTWGSGGVGTAFSVPKFQPVSICINLWSLTILLSVLFSIPYFYFLITHKLNPNRNFFAAPRLPKAVHPKTWVKRGAGVKFHFWRPVQKWLVAKLLSIPCTHELWHNGRCKKETTSWFSRNRFSFT